MRAWLGLAAASVMVTVTSASAAVVGFDDLDTSGGDVALAQASPYAGLTWSNTLAYGSAPGFDGFNSGIVSPGNAAYSGGEISGTSVVPVVGSISAGLFDFESAYVGAGYYDGLVVTFTGMRGGSVAFSRDVTVSTGGASLFSFGFTDIDGLLFQASTTAATTDPLSCGTFDCTQFTLDDVTVVVKDPEVHGVAEPNSLALLAVAAICALARRRGRSIA